MALDLAALRKTAQAQSVSTRQKPEKTQSEPPRSTLRRKVSEDEKLPEAPEIEHALLGVILRNAGANFPKFERLGRRGLFSDPINRELYGLAKSFYDGNGRFDLIGFTAHLRDSGRLEALGGAFRITDAYTQSAPDDVFDYYLAELLERYVRRKLITSSFALAGKAKTESLDDLLATLRGTSDYLGKVAVASNCLVDAAECLNGHKPEIPPELVRHILHMGSKMIIGGTSKGRKTMTLIDLAVSVATGSDWWGFHTKKGPVCYVNFEIQDAFFWLRVDEVCQAKEVSIEPGMFFAWNLRGQANKIGALSSDLLKVLKAYPFGLIIIDPIYKALGDRDENKAGDVASMLNEVENIAVETGAAVAFGAHYSKGDQSLKEHIDRIGGSGVFTRDPDSILTMTAHEEEDCFTVESTLRNFPPIKSFVMRWGWPLFLRDLELDPHDLKGRGSDSGKFEQKFSSDLLIELLIDNGALAPKEACKMLKDLKDVSRRTVYNMKEKLEKAGKVVTNSEGKWSLISDDSA